MKLRGAFEAAGFFYKFFFRHFFILVFHVGLKVIFLNYRLNFFFLVLPVPKTAIGNARNEIGKGHFCNAYEKKYFFPSAEELTHSK